MGVCYDDFAKINCECFRHCVHLWGFYTMKLEFYQLYFNCRKQSHVHTTPKNAQKSLAPQYTVAPHKIAQWSSSDKSFKIQEFNILKIIW